MGALRVSNEVILGKIEVTYNTDPTPTAGTNAMLVQPPSLSHEGLRMNERPSVRANINSVQQVYGISIPVELKGSGTAGTAPEFGPLLRACAMGETVVASTSVTYKPISSAHESITIWYYEGGRKLHKLTGCRGNVTFSVTAGGLALATFDMVGHVSDPTDASLPSPTVSTVTPKAALGMAISLGGVTAITVRSWSLNLNNTIAMPPSVGASDGYGEVQVTRADVSGELTMDAELASVIDTDAQLTAGTGLTFGSGALGASAGNIVTFTGSTSGLYWRDRTIGDEEGLRTRTKSFGIKDSSSGNDSIALILT